MRVLSIDVGIKNLSYCVLKSTECGEIGVLRWDVLKLVDGKCTKIGIETLTECLVECLLETFGDDFEADVVLIENQPSLVNPTMKTVGAAIYTYFTMLKVQFGNVKAVKFVSASSKLKCKKMSELSATSDVVTNAYKGRKKASIDLCRLYLPDICPERMAWFQDQPKRDDLSDAMLLGVYYIETHT